MAGYVTLIAVDGSAPADGAVMFYLKQLHRPGCKVVFAHIADTSSNAAFTFRSGLAVPQEEWKRMKEKEEKRRKLLREHYMELIIPQKVPYKFIVRDGHAGEQLCEIAKNEGVACMVIGTRGMGTVTRAILGSVSDYVLHHSKVPVIICQHRHRKTSLCQDALTTESCPDVQTPVRKTSIDGRMTKSDDNNRRRTQSEIVH